MIEDPIQTGTRLAEEWTYALSRPLSYIPTIQERSGGTLVDDGTYDAFEHNLTETYESPQLLVDAPDLGPLIPAEVDSRLTPLEKLVIFDSAYLYVGVRAFSPARDLTSLVGLKYISTALINAVTESDPIKKLAMLINLHRHILPCNIGEQPFFTPTKLRLIDSVSTLILQGIEPIGMRNIKNSELLDELTVIFASADIASGLLRVTYAEHKLGLTLLQMKADEVIPSSDLLRAQRAVCQDIGELVPPRRRGTLARRIESSLRFPGYDPSVRIIRQSRHQGQYRSKNPHP